MILLAITGIVCMAFGLYAGKKRANGLGWCKIVADCAVDIFTAVSSFFRAIPSRLAKGNPNSEVAPEVVEPEVA